MNADAVAVPDSGSEESCYSSGAAPWRSIALFGGLLLLLLAVAVASLVAWRGRSTAGPVGFPGWIVFAVGFVLIWGLLGWGLRPWRWRGDGGGPGSGGYEPAAEEVVRRRFARGEISSEQMTRLLRDLSATRPGSGPAAR